MSEDLGPRLRQARIARGLSLRGVAHAVGVSPSLISQVEVGKVQPSVSTLLALANHLEASLDDLMGLAITRPVPADRSRPDRSLAIQHVGDNPVIEMENGVRWERLASVPGEPVDALLVTYDPGAAGSSEGSLTRHSGIEYAYILEGELTLHLEFDEHVLRAGDSLRFDSERPHVYRNTGTKPARGVWFILGRGGTPGGPPFRIAEA